MYMPANDSPVKYSGRVARLGKTLTRFARNPACGRRTQFSS